MEWSIRNVREAPLTPSQVFSFYADPSTWGSWGHNTKWARAKGSLVEGSVVDVKAGYGRVWPVLVRRIETDRYIECEVRPPGMVVVNTYQISPIPGGVRLTHGISVSGRMARITRFLLFDKLYARLLAKETSRLVALAARAPAAQPEEVGGSSR